MTKTQAFPNALNGLVNADSFSSLSAALSYEDLGSLSVSEMNALWRRIQTLAGDEPVGKPVKVALLGNIALDFLPSFLGVRLASRGIWGKFHVAPFGQYYQEVLEPQSTLRKAESDIVILLLSLRALRPEQVHGFAHLRTSERRAMLSELYDHLTEWLEDAKDNLDASFVLANFVRPARPALGVADAAEEFGEAQFYAELNQRVAELCRSDPRVHLLDLQHLAAVYGVSRATDMRFYHLAKMEWTEGFLLEVAAQLERHLMAILGRTKKCLVVDLDNTLWGGVLGEDGVQGVKIGPGEPTAEAFLEFQRAVKKLVARGVVLAACSKNNPEDVAEFFEARKGLPLTSDDFSSWAINWEPKPQNLEAIASSLNIGLDSLVFVDDSPLEVSMVRELVPGVRALQLPDDPAARADWLLGLPEFEKTAVSAEDKQRTTQYKDNRKREEQKTRSQDLESYLYSLETRVQIRCASQADLDRVFQLFSKTNQFNLTTHRYSLVELTKILTAKDGALGLFSAEDKFGDLGVIGIFLVLRKNHAPHMDSFLMSCRAMGRGIETAVLGFIVDEFTKNGKRLSADFVPTKKNKPAADFLQKHGFQPSEALPEGGRSYVFDSGNQLTMRADWVNLEIVGDDVWKTA